MGKLNLLTKHYSYKWQWLTPNKPSRPNLSKSLKGLPPPARVSSLLTSPLAPLASASQASTLRTTRLTERPTVSSSSLPPRSRRLFQVLSCSKRLLTRPPLMALTSSSSSREEASTPASSSIRVSSFSVAPRAKTPLRALMASPPEPSHSTTRVPALQSGAQLSESVAVCPQSSLSRRPLTLLPATVPSAKTTVLFPSSSPRSSRTVPTTLIPALPSPRESSPQS